MASTFKHVSTTAAGKSVEDGGSYSGYYYSNFYNVNEEQPTQIFSPDGRDIVFTSSSPMLTGGNAAQNGIVIKNIENLPAGTVMSEYNGASGGGFTRDGSALIFETRTLNNSGPSPTQIRELNLSTGNVTTVSSGKTLGANQSESDGLLAASSDGHRVAFDSSVYTPQSGGGSFTHSGVFVEDLSTQQTIQIGDVSTSFFQTGFDSAVDKAIYTENPASGTNGVSQIYVEDTSTGVSTAVSSKADGTLGNGESSFGIISHDGSEVVFQSLATNLSSSATNGGIFVKNLSDQSLNVVASDQPTTQMGTTASGTEYELRGLSADGNKVALVQDHFTDTQPTTGSFQDTNTDQIQIADLRTHITTTVGQPVTHSSSYDSTTGSSTFSGSSFGTVEFSPDATRLAYTVYTQSGTGSTTTQTSQLYVYDANSGQTTSVVGPTTDYISNIQFSPDSHKIAYSTFSSSETVSGPQTTVYDLTTGASTTVPAYNVSFSPDSSSFAFSTYTAETPDDTNGLSDVYVASAPVCFATGTLIRTSRGDVAIESLSVGDMAVTASGAQRPIKWIGHRSFDCATQPTPEMVRPIRVRAGAFGGGRPYRDLLLSPHHAVAVTCVDEVLIPIRLLVNGTSIRQIDDATDVTYWHVELDSHDILLADGLPAESYIDVGNRCDFEGEATLTLHPQFESDALAGYCRPLVTGGAMLAAVRAQLAAMAGESGTAATGSAPFHLLVDGTPIVPAVDGHRAAFVVPAGTRDIRLVSPTWSPCDADLRSRDTRRLGLLVQSIAIDDMLGTVTAVPLDHPGLVAGFHPAERTDFGSWRWTDGDAVLSGSVWSGYDGPFVLRLTGQFHHAAAKVEVAEAA